MSRVRRVTIENTTLPVNNVTVRGTEAPKIWIDGLGFWLLVAFFIATIIPCTCWAAFTSYNAVIVLGTLNASGL
jgi:hypothetical protein